MEDIYNTILTIAAVIFGAWLFKRFGIYFLERIIKGAIRADKHSSSHSEAQREQTILHIIHTTLNVLLMLISAMIILDLMGLNIGPLVAGAGVIGVALGFGGQWLIKDLISGLFIIIENQYRVDDLVTLHTDVGEITGKVEDISLRMSILRDLDGQLHHVPNGTISVATNLSKDYSGLNLDIGISYDVDLEKVIKVVDAVGKELAEDALWKDKILDPPHFLRVDDFADSSVIIKILGTTKPLQQWVVTGELRKRLKIAFDKNKIEIPFPQRVMISKK